MKYQKPHFKSMKANQLKTKGAKSNVARGPIFPSTPVPFSLDSLQHRCALPSFTFFVSGEQSNCSGGGGPYRVQQTGSGASLRCAGSQGGRRSHVKVRLGIENTCDRAIMLWNLRLIIAAESTLKSEMETVLLSYGLCNPS